MNLIDKSNFSRQRGQFGRRLAIASGVIFGLCLSGCNQATNPQTQANSSPFSTPEISSAPQTQNKKQILTTFTVLADIAQNVAGDKATVESLTKQGVEIHGYDPTPSDLIKAQKADAIFDNGFGLERWAQKFYGNLKNVPKVTLSEGIQPISITEGTYQNKPNPHAWMSPKNALIYVENIRKALIQIDPANADTYNTNAANYSQQIKNIDNTLKTNLSVLPENTRFMITCEGAFSYLARDYGLKEGYLWAVNSDQQGTPQQVSKVINLIKENRVPAVFCENTVSDKAQQQVAKETGARFGGVFYVDSLSAANGNAPTYLKLLEYNVNTLIKGLKGN